MMVYLSSLLTYYIYFAKWDNDEKDDIEEENKVFCSWAICQILITFVESVLIYLFWGVTKVIEQDGEEGLNDIDEVLDSSWRIESSDSQPLNGQKRTSGGFLSAKRL